MKASDNIIAVFVTFSGQVLMTDWMTSAEATDLYGMYNAVQFKTLEDAHQAYIYMLGERV